MSHNSHILLRHCVDNMSHWSCRSNRYDTNYVVSRFGKLCPRMPFHQLCGELVRTRWWNRWSRRSIKTGVASHHDTPGLGHGRCGTSPVGVATHRVGHGSNEVSHRRCEGPQTHTRTQLLPQLCRLSCRIATISARSARARLNLQDKHSGQTTNTFYGRLQVSLDLTAAFDMVEWGHVQQALSMAGVEPATCEIIL